jgi:hypothetical protein
MRANMSKDVQNLRFHLQHLLVKKTIHCSVPFFFRSVGREILFLISTLKETIIVMGLFLFVGW